MISGANPLMEVLRSEEFEIDSVLTLRIHLNQVTET